MHSFADAKGRNWELEITIGSAKKFRDRIDLIDGQPPELAEAILTNIVLRLDMIWHFCTNREDISRDEFDDMLHGSVLKSAFVALKDEIVFFILSLRPEMEEAVPKMMKRFEGYMEKQAELLTEIVDSPESLEVAERELARIKAEAITSLSTGSPVSSASTPTP